MAWKMSRVHLRRMCVLLLVGCSVCVSWISLVYCVQSSISSLIFWLFYPLLRVWYSVSWIPIELSVSPFNSVRFCFVYFHSLSLMHKCVNGYTFLLHWTFTNISLPLVTMFDLSPFCLKIATLALFWLLFAWNFFFPSFHSQSSHFSRLQCLPSIPYWQGLELHHLAKEKGLRVLLQYHICVLCAKLLQSCPTLCHPMDCSLPGSSLLPHGL